MGTALTIIILTLLFSAFFSSIEIAFVSADPLRLTLKRNEKGRTAKLLNYFFANQDYFIATTLIGNTVSLVVFGIYMSAIMDIPLRDTIHQYIDDTSPALRESVFLLSQTTLSTLVVLAVAEFLPKNIALITPNRILEVLIHPMGVIYVLCYPFVWITISTNKFFLTKILGMPYSQKTKVVGLADINYYIQSQHSENENRDPEIDPEIFKNALEFRNLKVRDCMIPRTDIIAIDRKESIQVLIDTFISSGHSKILIYDDSIDNIIGYCHSLQMYKHPKTIDEIIAGILIVPATTRVQEMMLKFISSRKTIALVTDEFGGTAGIVTTEDIIEEILGDIEDEHDPISHDIYKLSDNHFVVSARYRVSDINSEFHWNFPEGDYETMGGFVLYKYGSVPQEGSQIEEEGYTITVRKMKGVRIDELSVLFHQTPPSNSLVIEE